MVNLLMGVELKSVFDDNIGQFDIRQKNGPHEPHIGENDYVS